MDVVKADILRGINPADDKKVVVLHGCNCFHVMGAGIARYLRQKFPKVYDADVNGSVRGDRSKLGTFTVCQVSPSFHILNCYTQYSFGSGEIDADYGAISRVLREVAEKYHGWEIRMPKIGCGLAGGNWDIVREIAAIRLNDENVTVYEK